MKRRDKYCIHFKQICNKKSWYRYDLIGFSLWLCKRCEKKLRKELIEQDKLENEIKSKIKRKKINSKKNTY